MFLYSAAAAVRAVLLAQAHLRETVLVLEVITPVTSYQALLEAQFLRRLGLDPYQGSAVHHPPLMVALHSAVEAVGGEAATGAVYVAADVLVGYLAGQLASGSWLAVVAAVYLFNPLTLLLLVSRSTAVFANAAVLLAFSLSKTGNAKAAALALATATYLEPYLVAFLPAVVLAEVGRGGKWYGVVGRYLACGAALVACSAVATGGLFSFLAACYSDIATFAQLSPNIGLWWYFFTEMFTFFTPFYLGVFNLFSVCTAVPLALKFHGTPSLHTLTLTTTHAWLTLTKPYPQWADLAVLVALVAGLTRAHRHMRYAPVLAVVVLFLVLLMPVTYYLWFLGLGNLNFYYAQNLVLGFGLVVLIGDLGYAGVCLQYAERSGSSAKIAQI